MSARIFFVKHLYISFLAFLKCWSDSINLKKNKTTDSMHYAGIMAELTLGLSVCLCCFSSLHLPRSSHTREKEVFIQMVMVAMHIHVYLEERRNEKWKRSGAVKNGKKMP